MLECEYSVLGMLICFNLSIKKMYRYGKNLGSAVNRCDISATQQL